MKIRGRNELDTQSLREAPRRTTGRIQNQTTGSSSEAVTVEGGLALDLDAVSEREKKVAELKALVQSGNYFKSRDINDIARSVYQGLDEQVDIFKSVGGRE